MQGSGSRCAYRENVIESTFINLVLQSSWSGCRPVTAETVGSSPTRTAIRLIEDLKVP